MAMSGQQADLPLSERRPWCIADSIPQRPVSAPQSYDNFDGLNWCAIKCAAMPLDALKDAGWASPVHPINDLEAA